MKKIILSVIIIIMIYNYSYSQNWEWTKKAPNVEYSDQRGVFTDISGNVYNYGSRQFAYYYSSSPLTDTIGSYLNCFNSSGTLLFKKRWSIPFYITKMIFEDNSIFFSATFYGTQTINGFTISSEGDTDGAIGKMDMNGNILWISTFGGTERDKCMGLTFNPATLALYATGCIKNSLSIDHVFKSTGKQSAIILQYNKSGIPLQHKLYDYVPTRDSWEINCGLEMSC
ncbi:MAG: hypothetical protein H0X46_06700, partial [Bacteroidetes bacterium]|nr:hypothetical protein [Bacteroidota bacterium]